MGSRFSIISSVYNEYELLRQFVESIIGNVAYESFDRVIIVDDYSWNKGRLREYETFVNRNFAKFHVVTHDEYRHAKRYQSGLMARKVVNDSFDYRLFDTEKPNNGVMISYQKALEYVNTEFVLVADTDCVFLSKFGSTFNEVGTFFDCYPKAMACSQLTGFSSDAVFESKVLGSKKIPKYDLVGGPSPMFTVFRMAAWTKHDLVPLCSRPWRHVGNGFNDFVFSTIANGYSLINYPFYSGDYVFHVGGGTANRNRGNLPRKVKWNYGSTKDTRHYGGRTRHEPGKTYDYYAGAHYLDMTSTQYKEYLEDKYSYHFGLIEPFDESLLHKLILLEDRETAFRPVSQAVTDKMEYFRGPRNEVNKAFYTIYDSYGYGTKPWPAT